METQRDRWEKSPTPPESLDASITRFLRGNFRGNLVSKKTVLLKLKHIFDDPWFPKKSTNLQNENWQERIRFEVSLRTRRDSNKSQA